MALPQDGVTETGARLEYGRVRPRSLRGVRWALLACLAGGLVGDGYWRSMVPTPAPVVPSVAVSPTINAIVEVPQARIDAERVYREEVVPLLDQFDARNRAAAAR